MSDFLASCAGNLIIYLFTNNRSLQVKTQKPTAKWRSVATWEQSKGRPSTECSANQGHSLLGFSNQSGDYLATRGKRISKDNNRGVFENDDVLQFCSQVTRRRNHFPSECQQNLVDDRSKYLLWRRYTEPKLSVKHLQGCGKKTKNRTLLIAGIQLSSKTFTAITQSTTRVIVSGEKCYLDCCNRKGIFKSTQAPTSRTE